MTYYLLASRTDGGRWTPQFGDKDRWAVVEEMKDQKMADRDWIGQTYEYRIVTFPHVPTQRQINAKLEGMA